MKIKRNIGRLTIVCRGSKALVLCRAEVLRELIIEEKTGIDNRRGD